jgi:hypothetical protein
MAYKDIEKRKATARAWRRNNPEKFAGYKKKYMASQEGNDKMWEYGIARKFGVTVEQYNAMLLRQGGLCAICRGGETIRAGKGFNPNKPRRLAVDHCHRTGGVRGLLCFNCNIALGKFGEDIERIRRALAYLEGR